MVGLIKRERACNHCLSRFRNLAALTRHRHRFQRRSVRRPHGDRGVHSQCCQVFSCTTHEYLLGPPRTRLRDRRRLGLDRVQRPAGIPRAFRARDARQRRTSDGIPGSRFRRSGPCSPKRTKPAVTRPDVALDRCWNVTRAHFRDADTLRSIADRELRSREVIQRVSGPFVLLLCPFVHGLCQKQVFPIDLWRNAICCEA